MSLKAAIQMIREADRGQLLIDAQDGIDQIVQAIEDAHGQGKGKITLTFEITSEVPGAFTIASKLDVKVPQPKRLDAQFFLNDSGELSRTDPRQPSLPQVVEADALNRRRQAGGDDD